MNSPSSPPDQNYHRLFIGTYTKTESRGIYSLELDVSKGTLSDPALAAETSHPSFLAFSPHKKVLFAISDSSALAASFAVGEKGQLHRLSPSLTTPAPAPTHLAVDRTGQVLLISHYAEGYIATAMIKNNGMLGTPSIMRHQGRGADPVRQDSPHVHSATISPDNRFTLVCDLGLDCVFSYALHPGEARISPADPAFVRTAPGAGPRHSVFAPDGRHLYVINELNSTITAYRYDAVRGTLSILASQSTLPPEFTGVNLTAEVRAHPNGRYVYGSNRGHDSIAVLERNSATGLLAQIEIVPCGGEHPRHFSLSPDGQWLVCANMNSDSLTVFRVDAETGRLTRAPSTASISMPVCVLFLD